MTTVYLKKLFRTPAFYTALLLASLFIFFCYSIFFKPLIHDKQGHYFVLDQGASAPVFVARLYESGLIQYPKLVLLLIKWRGDSQHLHAGEYFVKPTTSIWQLLNNVAAGKVALHALKIIEGWNFHQMMAAVQNNPYLTHHLRGLSDQEIMENLGYPHELPEGRFFPNTYLFSFGTSDITVVKQAYDLMDKILSQEWGHRDAGLPYTTSYQALIAASLIEKEASRVDERKRIAGVITRRLEKNMPLQIDATVIYSLGKYFSGILSKDDLKVPSVFNTYQHRYLPPTPIGLPGLTSIQAALHPASGNELYYVAKGNGQHYFSDSLDEHHRATSFYHEKEK